MDDIGPAPGIRPRPSLGRRLDATARACFPVACTVLLMMTTALPFGLAGQAQLLPAATLCCVWFWSVFRPAAMPPWAVFLIGVLYDLLGYLPLGVGVLTMLVAHAVAVRLRRWLVSQGFALVWIAFIPVAICGAAFGWLLGSLLQLRMLPVAPAAFQSALSVALYPALGIVFARAHRGVADPNRA